MRIVRQSRTMKVSNVDGKVQTNKEMRKHGNMLLASKRIVCVKLRQDERVDKPVGKFAGRSIREHVRRLLEKFLQSSISSGANVLLLSYP